MFIEEETFTRRIYAPQHELFSVNDFNKLKTFFNKVWAIVNGTRRKSHKYQLANDVLTVYDTTDNILHTEPIDNISHVDIIYNKIDRSGCIKFHLITRREESQYILTHIQQLDGEDHISTCILKTFLSNVDS